MGHWPERKRMWTNSFKARGERINCGASYLIFLAATQIIWVWVLGSLGHKVLKFFVSVWG